VEVAAGAAQRIADVVRETIAGCQQNRAASECGRPERAVLQLGFRRDAEGNASPSALPRIR
ncbi:MAG: hypothetical protein ABI469_09450, partial [Gemmatimonadales bacterium]